MTIRADKLDRRQFVCGSLAFLTACGKSTTSGGLVNSFVPAPVPPADISAVVSGSTTVGAPLNLALNALGVTPAITYYSYLGDTLSTVTAIEPSNVADVSAGPDRFATGPAVQYNGTTSKIVVPGLPELDINNFAFSAWVRTISKGPMAIISISEGQAPLPKISLRSDSEQGLRLDWGQFTSTPANDSTGQYVNDGGWHHVLVQSTENAASIYLDGALVGSVAFGGPTTSDSFAQIELIGRGETSVFDPTVTIGADSASAWVGEIDSVRFYNRSFNPAAIPLFVFRWAQVNPAAAFQPRDGAGLLSFDNQMWLLGGWNPDISPVTNSEVWSSSDGVNWTLQTIAAWPRRHSAGWAVYGNRIWVCGGDILTGNYEQDVWSSADGVNWTEVTNEVPWENRTLTMVAPFAGNLWLMGGVLTEEVSGNVAFSDVYSTTDGRSWVKRSSAAPWSPRGMILGNAVFDNRIWVIGGGTYDIRTYNNDVWSSADGANWTLVDVAAPWVARAFHSVAVFADKMWVIAGATADNPAGTNDVWYSGNGSTWLQLPGTPWAARHATSVCTFGGFLWLTCGSSTQTYNDVWQLTYAA
jgi:hypothetical protein